VATPHLGAQTREAQERTSTETAEMVLAALAEYRGHYRDLPSIDLLNSRGKKCGHVSTNGKVWLGDCQVWPPRSMPTQIATV